MIVDIKMKKKTRRFVMILFVELLIPSRGLLLYEVEDMIDASWLMSRMFLWFTVSPIPFVSFRLCTRRVQDTRFIKN